MSDQKTVAARFAAIPLSFLFMTAAAQAQEAPPSPSGENAHMATANIENFAVVNGQNAINYESSPNAVTVVLRRYSGTGTGTGGFAQGDTYAAGIEHIIGANSPVSAGYNRITGNQNPNRIYGMGSSSNILDGREGADTLVGSPSGWNWVSYVESTGAVNINMGTNIHQGGFAHGDRLYNIDAVDGSAFADTFTGSERNEYSRGNRGNNFFDPKGGNDKSYGDVDSDTYVYTSGNDQITEIVGTTPGIDTVRFASTWTPAQATISGNTVTFTPSQNSITFNDITLIERFSFSGRPDMTLDQFRAASNAAPPTNSGNDSYTVAANTQYPIDGGAGWDTVSFVNLQQGVTVNLDPNMPVGNINLRNIESVVGTNFNDNFYGTSRKEQFKLNGGDDYVFPGGGDDMVLGDGGYDISEYSGDFANYTIQTSGSATFVTDRRADGDGIDTLYNVEELRFRDGAYVNGHFSPDSSPDAFVLNYTMRAQNVNGISDPSNVMTKGGNRIGINDTGFRFDEPSRAVNDSCLTEYPVTDYHVSFYSTERPVTGNYSFSVTDPDMVCYDKVTEYDAKCGHFIQTCEITVPLNAQETELEP